CPRKLTPVATSASQPRPSGSAAISPLTEALAAGETLANCCDGRGVNSHLGRDPGPSGPSEIVVTVTGPRRPWPDKRTGAGHGGRTRPGEAGSEALPGLPAGFGAIHRRGAGRGGLA